ncbi:MAG: hypothetical protein ACYDBB_17310 [Armatimonadota bacterium]
MIIRSLLKTLALLFILLLFTDTMMAEDLPVLVELREGISALYPHSETTLWAKTEKGLFEVNTETKQVTCLVDEAKPGRYVDSDVSWRFGAYTVAEKKPDGTYVYNIHEGKVIHRIPSHLFISRLDYVKPAEMLILDGYNEKAGHHEAVITDIAGQTAKQVIDDTIVEPVDQDPSCIVGLNIGFPTPTPSRANKRKTSACARITRSGKLLWQVLIDANFRIQTISVAPRRNTVLMIAGSVIPPVNNLDPANTGLKLWTLRLSDGKVLKEVWLHEAARGISLSPSQEYAVLIGSSGVRMMRLPGAVTVSEHQVHKIGLGMDDAIVTDAGEVLYYYRPFTVKGPATIGRVRKDGTVSTVWEGNHIPDAHPAFRSRVLAPLADGTVFFRHGTKVLRLPKLSHD